MKKPNLLNADIFQENTNAVRTDQHHEVLYRLDTGKWALRAGIGHRKPVNWTELTVDEAAAWLGKNDWTPEEVTLGVNRTQVVWTRSLDESLAEFHRRAKTGAEARRAQR